MQKATRQQTRALNSQLVLKTIYNAHTISRAEIARLTSLTRPTVSAIVEELLAERLVIESGMGESAGGKRPILLEMDTQAHRIVAIDLGSQTLRGALFNLKGELLEKYELPLLETHGDGVLQKLYDLVDLLISKCASSVLGVAVGTPGTIDPLGGIVHQSVNLQWNDFPLKAILEERYQLPVYLTNDSHAAALAEYTFGNHPDKINNLILVKIGLGIGAGIVLGGQPFYGDGFAAGEVGHLVVVEKGNQCSCGNLGCLETVASSRAILREARVITQHPQLVWEELIVMLDEGDERVQNFVQSIGHYVGRVVGHLIAAYNVHQVVLSGRTMQFGEPFLQAVRYSAENSTLPALVKQTNIRFSQLSTDIVLWGCAAVVLKQELAII